ncbi:hypothetical protein [Sediminibacillus massiliensis]|uniref:hypothetical protein n=1 Tax=Sediminibacillus massiliensis TaxID=1926277 RepID=UPI0009887CF0|nr:hypothetical protein [Sediminibacillus massiliensis]
MKIARFFLLGILFLTACSTGEEGGTDKEAESGDSQGTTYGFEPDLGFHEENGWLLPLSYQVTVDESFERISRYVTGTSEKMFFWHEPSASKYTFDLETTTDKLQEEVPTIEINPVKKDTYAYMEKYFSLDLEEADGQEIKETVEQAVKENAEAYLEEMKDKALEASEGESKVYTNEEYDIEPFTYMIESESAQGVLQYKLFGEAEEEYLRATLSIPDKKKEDLFDGMLASLRTITYNKEEFKENAVYDQPTRLSYEPAENLTGAYPEVGYSFENPEAATFRHSFPTFHTYRYTFGTLYEEEIEREHFGLRSSELVVRAAKAENARTREEEIRNRQLDDFVAFQYDYARSVEYLHEDENFDTGVFTTGVRVEFDGYEEYWFLREADGHVYEVTFDLAFDAPEYDELLDSYLNVVRSFEHTNIEEE